MKNTILLIAFSLLATLSFGQDIKSLTQEKSGAVDSRLHQLIFDIQPCIYLNENGQVNDKTNGLAATKIVATAETIRFYSQLTQKNLEEVRLIEIKIQNEKEFNGQIDLSFIKDLSKLEFIYLSIETSIEGKTDEALRKQMSSFLSLPTNHSTSIYYATQNMN